MVKQRAQVFFLCICSVLFSSRPGYAKEKITFTPKEAGQHQAKPESCEIQFFKTPNQTRRTLTWASSTTMTSGIDRTPGRSSSRL